MSTHCRSRTAGFTLIELLVVIAIIGVLMGLLLPAVQMTREAARRTKCANHLKQIGLAAHNYHNSHKALPPSRTGESDGVTWAWLILPHLEQDNLYRQVDLDKPLYQANSKALRTAVPVYFCPSRREPGGATVAFVQGSGCGSQIGLSGAPGDYAASLGASGVDHDLQTGLGLLSAEGAFQRPRDVPATGFAGPGSTKRFRGRAFRDIVDGLSNTFLAGEKHVPVGSLNSFPWDCSLYDGHQPACSMRGAGPGLPLADSKRDKFLKFGSYHPGVCQFVYCDGSVRSLRNSVNEVTLGLLANIHDGQPIPEY